MENKRFLRWCQFNKEESLSVFLFTECIINAEEKVFRSTVAKQ